MIKHIALFKFKPFENLQDKDVYYSRLVNAFATLCDDIPQLKSFEIGFDILESEASYDFIVNAEIENLNDLKIYANHPKHLIAAKVVRERAIDRKVIDYKF